MTMPMYQPGSGTFWAGTKLKPAIARRIEWLGQQNDRVNACLATNDADGLRVLASEYAARGMLRTANKVMRLVEGSTV